MMLNVAAPSLVRPTRPFSGKTDYWYVMYHEVVDEETMLDHGKTHIDASENPPRFATLSNLLEYALRRSNLPYPRITLEAVTCLTLFGQRYVALGEKVRPNAVYHVYFRPRSTTTPAANASLEDDSETEHEE
ncbi:hypothetical protein AAVH_29527 [Aphelenchoides avenae]|nr:hypothetical protein AAVH_29527 [Aphelenchus avenae]